MDNIETFGELVKYIRTVNKITTIQLAGMCNVSQRHIQRIESSDTLNVSIHTVHALSNALNVNLVEYSSILSDFTSLDEYKIYTEIRYEIENRNINNLAILLNKIDFNELNEETFTLYTQVIYYANAMVLVHIKKDLKTALSYCYKAINTNEIKFNPDNINKYITNEISYALLGQIEYLNFSLNNTSISTKIATSLIEFIELKYYNEKIPIIAIPKIPFRTYITMLNNKADILFEKNNYLDALNLCNKAIDTLKDARSTYIKHALLFLQCKIYYQLNDIENSQKLLNKSVNLCIIDDNYSFINNTIKPKVESKYPLLTIPTIY